MQISPLPRSRISVTRNVALRWGLLWMSPSREIWWTDCFRCSLLAFSLDWRGFFSSFYCSKRRFWKAGTILFLKADSQKTNSICIYIYICFAWTPSAEESWTSIFRASQPCLEKIPPTQHTATASLSLSSHSKRYPWNILSPKNLHCCEGKTSSFLNARSKIKKFALPWRKTNLFAR